MPDFTFEDSFRTRDAEILCGCDEAGRGPLAGPVYAAAVILPRDFVIEGLDDSKKLSASKREKLYEQIKQHALAYAIARSEVEEIERINILEASQLAMRRAVEQVAKQLAPDLLLVDGNIVREFPCKAIPVIGGDAKCTSIAAASILAKVERDRDCLRLDASYPQYGFAKHKGYGTKQHREAILRYGPCPEHRKSFLKKLLGTEETP